MGSARVSLAFPGSVHEAQARWYDTRRWEAWVDGLARVVSVQGNWPHVGASVSWESGPAGRGRVHERVVAHEELVRQTVEVQDEAIQGHQTVSFTPLDGSVEVELKLEYELKKRSIVTPLVDALFIRRAMASSLRATLTRFGVELAGARRADVG